MFCALRGAKQMLGNSIAESFTGVLFAKHSLTISARFIMKLLICDNFYEILANSNTHESVCLRGCYCSNTQINKIIMLEKYVGSYVLPSVVCHAASH